MLVPPHSLPWPGRTARSIGVLRQLLFGELPDRHRSASDSPTNFIPCQAACRGPTFSGLQRFKNNISEPVVKREEGRSRDEMRFEAVRRAGQARLSSSTAFLSISTMPGDAEMIRFRFGAQG
jgi:hypothetical protein